MTHPTTRREIHNHPDKAFSKHARLVGGLNSLTHAKRRKRNKQRAFETARADRQEKLAGLWTKNGNNFPGSKRDVICHHNKVCLEVLGHLECEGAAPLLLTYGRLMDALIQIFCASTERPEYFPL